MKIGIGADLNAAEAKDVLMQHVENLGHEAVSYGGDATLAEDYPGVAFETAEAVLKGEVDRGILICGTGIGMAISANKIPGIRAAQVHDPYSAERAALSNNAQVITFGSKVIATDVMVKLTTEYLSHPFEGINDNSKRKVNLIMDKEQEKIGK